MPDGNIKLLGAAIGSQSWCDSLLKRRVVKARNLLDAIGPYPDAQGAFVPALAAVGPRCSSRVGRYLRPSKPKA